MVLRPALISELGTDLFEAEQGCSSHAGFVGTGTHCNAGRQADWIDRLRSTNSNAASGEAGGVVAVARSAFQNGGSSTLSMPGSMSWLHRLA